MRFMHPKSYTAKSYVQYNCTFENLFGRCRFIGTWFPVDIFFYDDND